MGAEVVSEHPTQPLVVDEHGVVRFKRNEVVRYMLDHPDADLNVLGREVELGRLPVADYMQLMQLIGYSVSGYGDCAYSSEHEVWREHADKMDAEAATLWMVRNAGRVHE